METTINDTFNLATKILMEARRRKNSIDKPKTDELLLAFIAAKQIKHNISKENEIIDKAIKIAKENFTKNYLGEGWMSATNMIIQRLEELKLGTTNGINNTGDRQTKGAL